MAVRNDVFDRKKVLESGTKGIVFMLIDIQRIIQAIETLRFFAESERTEYYDSVVAPLIEDAAAAVDIESEPGTLTQWLHVQSATLDFAVEDITDVTYELSQRFPEQLQRAITDLPPEQRIRLQWLIREFQGQENLPLEVVDRVEAFRTRNLSVLGERLSTSLPTDTGIFGDFVETSTLKSTRGFTIIHGTFTLFDPDAKASGTYTVNTGGGAPNYRTLNGPLPPGIYRVSNHRPSRTTAGMVLEDVGYSFDINPAEGTQVFGRSLFRIHPDGRSPGTNGCLGVREGVAGLRQCEAKIVGLLRSIGSFKISVRY